MQLFGSYCFSAIPTLKRFIHAELFRPGPFLLLQVIPDYPGSFTNIGGFDSLGGKLI